MESVFLIACLTFPERQLGLWLGASQFRIHACPCTSLIFDSYFLFIRGFQRSKVSTSKVRNASFFFIQSAHFVICQSSEWTWFPSLEIIYKSVIRFQILNSSGARIKTSVAITKCAIVLIFKRNFLTNESYCTICQEKGDRLQIRLKTLQFRRNLLNQRHVKVDVIIDMDAWLLHV